MGLNPSQDFHQGTLTGTVLTDHRQDFTCREVEMNTLKCSDTGEAFGDTLNLE